MKYYITFLSCILLFGCSPTQKENLLLDKVYKQNDKKIKYLITEIQLNELPTRSFTLSNCYILDSINNFLISSQNNFLDEDIEIKLKDRQSTKGFKLKSSNDKIENLLDLGNEIDYQIKNYHSLFFKFKDVQIHPYIDVNYKSTDSIKINLPIEGIGFMIPNIYHLEHNNIDFNKLTVEEKMSYWIESYAELNKSEFNSIIFPKDNKDSLRFIYSYPLPSGKYREEKFSIRIK